MILDNVTEQKFVSLEELSEIVKRLKKENKIIAHCHGCFDLFHIGHLRHIKAAKNLCDVLVVTITPDRFVNKGEGRPAFNEQYRAEMISALEMVDYVAINNWPSAVETLKLLSPHYFVKGSDYKEKTGNVNPNIYEEEKVCRDLGIILYYTDEITSSSTYLLNKYFAIK
ncbi:adenylyltransferase/cytidyltransferase family protein [Geobacillus sp. Geo 8.1]